MTTYKGKSKYRKIDYLTYGATHNKPLTVTHADGSVTIEEPKTRKELQTIIRKGHRNRR